VADDKIAQVAITKSRETRAVRRASASLSCEVTLGRLSSLVVTGWDAATAARRTQVIAGQVSAR